MKLLAFILFCCFAVWMAKGQSIYTNRFIIVITAQLASNANVQMIDVDTNVADRRTFAVALATNGTTPQFYACEWAMSLRQFNAVSNKIWQAIQNNNARVFRVPTNTIGTVMARFGFRHVTNTAGLP